MTVIADRHEEARVNLGRIVLLTEVLDSTARLSGTGWSGAEWVKSWQRGSVAGTHLGITPEQEALLNRTYTSDHIMAAYRALWQDEYAGEIQFTRAVNVLHEAHLAKMLGRLKAEILDKGYDLEWTVNNVTTRIYSQMTLLKYGRPIQYEYVLETVERQPTAGGKDRMVRNAYADTDFQAFAAHLEETLSAEDWARVVNAADVGKR